MSEKVKRTIHQSDLYGNGCNDNRANDYKRRHVFNAATRHRYNTSVFSAGGSSNLCVYLGIGIVMSIYRHNCDTGAVNIRVYDSLKK